MGFKLIKNVFLVLGISLISTALCHAQSEKPPLDDERKVEEEAPQVIRYPMLTEGNGQIYPTYYIELLKLALAKAGKEYTLEPVPLVNFHESRSVMSVAKGLYDIHWMNTNVHRETVLRPIQIPLFKGLIGWRLLMIRAEDQALLSGPDSLETLKSLRMVQGHDWPDLEILERNGFNVARASNKEGMFRMLHAGRVDLFPRSMIEIWNETESFSELSLAVDEHIVLVYPAAYYFFVRRADKALAEVIELGLNRAIEDGSFDDLLMRYVGESIKRSNLENRRVLHLSNPLMTPATPYDRSELWFRP